VSLLEHDKATEEKLSASTSSGTILVFTSCFLLSSCFFMCKYRYFSAVAKETLEEFIALRKAGDHEVFSHCLAALGDAGRISQTIEVKHRVQIYLPLYIYYIQILSHSLNAFLYSSSNASLQVFKIIQSHFSPTEHPLRSSSTTVPIEEDPDTKDALVGFFDKAAAAEGLVRLNPDLSSILEFVLIF